MIRYLFINFRLRDKDRYHEGCNEYAVERLQDSLLCVQYKVQQLASVRSSHLTGGRGGGVKKKRIRFAEFPLQSSLIELERGREIAFPKEPTGDNMKNCPHRYQN